MVRLLGCLSELLLGSTWEPMRELWPLQSGTTMIMFFLSFLFIYSSIDCTARVLTFQRLVMAAYFPSLQFALLLTLIVVLSVFYYFITILGISERIEYAK